MNLDEFVERRAHPRWPTSFQARIEFYDSQMSAGCVVQDLSQGGARLLLEGDITLPDRFLLSLPNQPHAQRAIRCWREGPEMGVAFEYDDDDGSEP